MQCPPPHENAKKYILGNEHTCEQLARLRNGSCVATASPNPTVARIQEFACLDPILSSFSVKIDIFCMRNRPKIMGVHPQILIEPRVFIFRYTGDLNWPLQVGTIFWKQSSMMIRLAHL